MLRRLALALSLAAAGNAAAQAPQTIGWIEPVEVGDGALLLQAKIDTGADSSSIDVDSLAIERRDDANWAVFTVKGKAGPVRFEQRIVRWARVKRVAGGAQRRPVIRLALCIDAVYALTEVNLTEREAMRYPMLVGRSFLAGRFAVDPSRKNTTRPRCAPAGGQ